MAIEPSARLRRDSRLQELRAAATEKTACRLSALHDTFPGALYHFVEVPYTLPETTVRWCQQAHNIGTTLVYTVKTNYVRNKLTGIRAN